MKLTKQDLIKPTNHFTIKEIPNTEHTIALRYLTQNEKTNIQTLQNKGTGTTTITQTEGKTTKTTRINTNKQTQAQNQAKILAISLALSCDGIEYTTEEVNCFKPECIDLIYMLVCEMNKL